MPQDGKDDATESSQDLDILPIPTLLEKLFALREGDDDDSNNTGISYMSARLLAIESTEE